MTIPSSMKFASDLISEIEHKPECFESKGGPSSVQYSWEHREGFCRLRCVRCNAVSSMIPKAELDLPL